MKLINASSASRICTCKPELPDLDRMKELKDKINLKLNKAGKEFFDPVYIQDYMETAGMATDAKNWNTLNQNLYAHEEDPLPLGAKTYMQEIWLYNNYGLITYALSPEGFETRKGTVSEEGAILVLNQALSTDYQKTPDDMRQTKDVFTGLCDIFDGRVIRDIKSPKDWQSFRAKKGIDSIYYWQLIGYCYLLGVDMAYLDYVLMPTPEALHMSIMSRMSEEEIDEFLLNEEAVRSLSPKQRVKSYQIDPSQVEKDVAFLVKRIQKCKDYYLILNYEICMGYESVSRLL